MDSYKKALIEQSRILSPEEKISLMKMFETMPKKQQTKLISILEKEEQAKLQNQIGFLNNLTKTIQNNRRKKIEEIYTKIATQDLDNMLSQIY